MRVLFWGTAFVFSSLIQFGSQFTSTASAASTIEWTQCAVEGESCNFIGSRLVRFGAGGDVITKTLNGPVNCSTATFGGDPALAISKRCSVQTVWTACASEDQQCSFTGTKIVRFGTGALFSRKTLSGPVTCNVATFGDPAFGLAKHCEISDATPASIDLAGVGIESEYAPNCTPNASLNDFMENVSWSGRRIEPRDCGLVKIRTPIFSWPMPQNLPLDGYMTLRVWDKNGNPVFSSSKQVPRLIGASLMPGLYQWSISYTDKYGQPVNSQRRSFVVQSNATFVLPSGNQFADAVLAKKEHPRILPSQMTFAEIASRAANPAYEYSASYGDFLQRALNHLSDPIVAVPDKLGLVSFATKQAFDDWSVKTSSAGKLEAAAIENLAYAAVLSQNGDLKWAAIARADKLAQWDVDGPTGEVADDQANRQIYVTLAKVYDLYYSSLNSAQQARIIKSILDRVKKPIDKFKEFDAIPYNSHLSTATMYALETLMYVADTPGFPAVDARPLLIKAWDVAITMSAVWGGSRDGGYANGTGYAWVVQGDVARFMAAVRIMANINLVSWPALSRVGDNIFASTPANAYLMGQMGDSVETRDSYFQYSWEHTRLLANVTQIPEYRWYWRKNPSNIALTKGLPAIHYFMLGTHAAPTATIATPQLPNSYVFEDAGFVAMHSSTVKSDRSSVFFRSSRFGSWNHSHADNNAFNYVVGGKEILISSGYYNKYESPFTFLVTRATRYKNALTFDDGIGQAEPTLTPLEPSTPVRSADARGKLINFKDTGTWAVTTGDGTLAYRGFTQFVNGVPGAPFFKEVIRTVAYNRSQGIVLVYDWVDSDNKHFWELNFQSLYPPTNMVGRNFKLENGGMSACIQVVGPAGGLTTDTAFATAAAPGQANQSHTRFRVTTDSKKFVAITLIRENCNSVPVDVKFSGSTTSIVTVNQSAPIIFDRRSVLAP